MTAVVGSVAIDLQAQLARFESDMGRAARIAEKNMQQMERSVNAQLGKMNRQMEGFASTVKSIFAGVSVGTFATFEKQLVDVADHINDLSKQFGISTEALSIWRLSADKSGTSLDGIAKGAKVLTKDLGDSEAKLKSMGISLRDASGNVKPMEKVMEEIAKKFAGYKDGAEKAAAASALFGAKIGPELIPFLDDFGKNVDEQKRRAVAFGVVIGPGLAAAADQFNDNMRDAKAIAEGFGNGVLNVVLPALNKFMGAQIDEAAASKGMVTQGEKVGEWLKDIAIGLVLAKNTMDVFVDGLGFMKDAALTVFALIGKQAGALGEYMSTAWRALTDFTGNPIERVKTMGKALDKLWTDLNANASGAMTEMAGHADDFGANLNKNILDVTDAFDAFAPSVKASATAIDQAGKSAQTTAPHIQTLAEKEKAAAEAAKKFALEQKEEQRIQEELSKAWQEGVGRMGELIHAEEKLTKNIKDARNELKFEGDQIGLDSDAQELNARMRQLVAQFTDKETGAVDSAAAAFLREAPAIIAANQAKQHAADISRMFVPTERDAANAIAQAWAGASNSISTTLADAFTGAFDSFKDFGKSMLNIAKKLIADLIAEFLRLRVIGPMMQSVFNSVGGAGGGITGYGTSALAQSVGGGSALGTLGQIGGIAGGLGLVSQGYHSGNPLVGGVGGALAAYSGITAAASGVFGGALAGAAAGSVVPIVGTLIGFAVGAIIAYMHKAPKPPEIEVAGALGSVHRIENTANSPFGPTNINTVGSGQVASAAVASAITDFDKLVAGFLSPEQIAAATQRLATFDVDLKKGAATIENVLGQRWDAILSTFPQDIQDVVHGAGDLQAQVQKLAEVLQFPAQLQALLEQLGQADMLAGMSQYEQQLFQLNAQFDAYAAQATALGATQEQITQIETYRTSALQRLTDAQVATTNATDDAAAAEERLRQNRLALTQLLDGAIWDDYLSGLSDFDKQIAQIHHQFQEMYNQAVQLGAGERELAAIRRLEANAIDRVTEAIETFLDPRGSIYQILTPVEDAANNLAAALQHVAQYLLSLKTNEQLSTLTPQQRLGEAQAQFNAMLAQARSGNVDAINSLPQYAQTLLEQARQFWSSGPNYDAIFQSVTLALQSITKQFGSGSTDPFVRMANALELHLPSIDAALQQIASSPAAMPSYDSGTDFVPYDQVAKIHRGEAVLTASENAARKRGASSQDVGVSREVAALLRELIQEVKASGKVGSDQRVRIAAGIEKVGAAKSRNG